MNMLEKLNADIALDVDLPLEERLASLTSDAVALATRLDAVFSEIRRTANENNHSDIYELLGRARAIMEGRIK